jgi:hypothetical protein
MAPPRDRRARLDDTAARTKRSRGATLSKAATGLTVLVGTALHPSPVFAHNVFETYNVWDDGHECTKMYSEISHGNGNGYVKSVTRSYTYPATGPSGCNDVLSRPSGFIRSRWTLVKKNGPGVFDMAACIGPDFGGIDPFYAYSGFESFDWGSEYWVPAGSGDTPPCGYGTYSNVAEGGVRFADSWHSGSAFPGWHDFLAPK